MKTTVTLSPTEIQDIIKESLQEKFKTVVEVKLIVKKELVGHQMNEYYTAVFKGAECEVEI